MLLPLLLLVLAKVSLESFLAPWAVDGIGDGCECRDGLVHAGVLEELSMVVSLVLLVCKQLTNQCQCPVSTHTVPCDADFAGI